MTSDPYDPSLNTLHDNAHPFDSFFYPETVAVIGATEKEGSVGRTLMWNLLRSPFGGTIYPVNLTRESILGVKAYKSVKAIDKKIDLAVVATPAKIVLSVIDECVEAGVRSVVIISAGFKEIGKEGEELEAKILEKAKKSKIRIIGPNCLGLMNPMTGLNATFAADTALKGNIAFLSQSGALCTAVLDWSLKEKVGFSSFVSTGSMMDVGWGDLINYFGKDPNTKSILLYMESIGDTRSFLSAAREVSLKKPIILIKAGRTEESAKAAVSHTGALAGSDDVLNAALNRVGVLRVDTISDLFSMAEILAKQPRPKGPNLTIITNAGGPGVIATDALIQNGGQLAPVDQAAVEKLSEFLPKEWSHSNPVDILGDASPSLYAKTIKEIMKDEKTDGLLVVLTPQYMTDPTKTAQEIIQNVGYTEKPLLTSWMGAKTVAKGAEHFVNAGIPCFEYPDDACKSFAYMWQYSKNLQSIYETPVLMENYDQESFDERKAWVDQFFDNIEKEGRFLLNEAEAKQVLKRYGIPVAETIITTTKEEAVKAAEEMGYPVVVKLYSETITHKSDMGGVKLNLKTAKAVEEAFEQIEKSITEKVGKKAFQGVTVQPMISGKGIELILGASLDPQFGPVLLFGSGGELVEVFKDKALALPPLTSTLARRMIEKTKIYKALENYRGQQFVELSKLEKTLVLFANMIAQNPRIKECDINPILASNNSLMALDARIVLNDSLKELPKLAIRPYPHEYVQSLKITEEVDARLRPIRPEDEPCVLEFYKQLSEDHVVQRYLKSHRFGEMVDHQLLVDICFKDYDREMSIICEKKDNGQILAIANMTKVLGSMDAFFAINVRDGWHHVGIGSKMIAKLVEIAKKEQIHRLYAEIHKENEAMLKIMKKLGFSLQDMNHDSLIKAEIILD
ncbi:MAG TPA: bifunctional acetate--CoA ligase family protein/GNAT family N-acetyltransferase [Chlamydiales bacterium]|nr:bifunctional acetate--CoA ligase family protein/GNAT family N-acetyltransferase [Chlamydiales bacterium]